MTCPNHASFPMASSLKAAALYVAIVFAAGFVLGTLRVLVVEPAFGPVIAVLLELPVLLVISWLVCTRIIGWFNIPATTIDCLVMGALAFGLLMIIETDACGSAGACRPNWLRTGTAYSKVCLRCLKRLNDR
jgi:hypothetical protein